jgi:hypothetical protein
LFQSICQEARRIFFVSAYPEPIFSFLAWNTRNNVPKNTLYWNKFLSMLSRA